MKPKILQLLLLFLFTSLIVSSKQNFFLKRNSCSIKIPVQKREVKQDNIKSDPVKAGYPYALAPGSYIFFY